MFCTAFPRFRHELFMFFMLSSVFLSLSYLCSWSHLVFFGYLCPPHRGVTLMLSHSDGTTDAQCAQSCGANHKVLDIPAEPARLLWRLGGLFSGGLIYRIVSVSHRRSYVVESRSLP